MKSLIASAFFLASVIPAYSADPIQPMPRTFLGGFFSNQVGDKDPQDYSQPSRPTPPSRTPPTPPTPPSPPKEPPTKPGKGKGKGKGHDSWGGKHGHHGHHGNHRGRGRD